MAKKAVSSAELIAGNVDLLSEILLRVPAKSLIRFRSVSRQWLALLSDSNFCCNHTRHNPSPPISGLYFSYDPSWLPLHGKITHVPFCDDRRPTTLPNFSFLNGSEAGNLRVCHSSNGLMLCSNRDQTYVVCNLTTQKFVVLPKISDEVKSNLYDRIRSYLIYDPRKSLHYKVVFVSSLYGDNSKFDVYSSESSSWTRTVATPGNPDRPDRWWSITNGAAWNGAIFWICHMVALEEGRSKHYHACFLFDINAKKLTRTPMPSLGSNAYEEILYFGECEGRLLLIPGPCYGATEFRMLEVMHITQNEFRWTVKYIIDSPVILPPLPTRSCRFFAGCVMNVGANENDLAVVMYHRWKVIQYNIVSKSLKVLFEFPSLYYPSFASNYEYSYQFIQSLAPI